MEAKATQPTSERPYGWVEYLWARLNVRKVRNNPILYEGFLKRAGILDYSWTLEEQMAHERYEIKRRARAITKEVDKDLTDPDGMEHEARATFMPPTKTDLTLITEDPAFNGDYPGIPQPTRTPHQRPVSLLKFLKEVW
jgi:hypothetical protein